MSDSSVNPPDASASPEAGVSGLQSLFGAAAAIVGVFAAGYPASALARALRDAIPALGASVPIVIAAVGSIVAAFSRPPRLATRS